MSFTSSGKQSKKPSKNRKNKRPFAQGNKKHDTDFHFSNSGRLVAGRQLVYLIDDELGKDQVYRFCTKKILDDLFFSTRWYVLKFTWSFSFQIGWYSEENGLYLNEFDDAQSNNEINDKGDDNNVGRNKKEKSTTYRPQITTTTVSAFRK